MTNLTRRRLMQAATLSGAAVAIGALNACSQQSAQSAPAASAATGESATGHSQQSYPCYGTHQAGIVEPHQNFGIVCAFDLTAQNVSQLSNYFRALTARIEFLTQGGELQDGDKSLPPAGSGILGKVVPPDGLTITVSVGASLFDQRFGLGDKKPKHLQEMRDFPNDKLQAAWCDGDISIQFCAFSPETCQNALRDIIKNTSAFAVPRWSIDGFLPKTEPDTAARNLFGFRDGTANPNISDPKIADSVLWTGVAENSLDEPAWTKNGSYQAIRLIRHFVEFWDRTPLQEQEAIFGRDKYSGAPLGMQHEHDTPNYASDPNGDVVPKDSHMRLANPRDAEFLKRHQLYRRPFDYSRGLAKNGQLDVGLVFICYQANLADGFLFVQNLLNLEPLEEYISPFGGGYFFTLAGVQKGEFLAQNLLS